MFERSTCDCIVVERTSQTAQLRCQSLTFYTDPDVHRWKQIVVFTIQTPCCEAQSSFEEGSKLRRTLQDQMRFFFLPVKCNDRPPPLHVARRTMKEASRTSQANIITRPLIAEDGTAAHHGFWLNLIWKDELEWGLRGSFIYTRRLLEEASFKKTTRPDKPFLFFPLVKYIQKQGVRTFQSTCGSHVGYIRDNRCIALRASVSNRFPTRRRLKRAVPACPHHNVTYRNDHTLRDTGTARQQDMSSANNKGLGRRMKLSVVSLAVFAMLLVLQQALLSVQISDLVPQQWHSKNTTALSGLTSSEAKEQMRIATARLHPTKLFKIRFKWGNSTP
ncbi:hypothetical protein Bbelb_157980, partial [Branchiostoma belcheri]